MNKKTIDESGMEVPTMNCGNCMYAHLIPKMGSDGTPLFGENQLVCMHSPPQMLVITIPTPAGMQTAFRSQFPAISEQMMCHQHEADPAHFDMITGEPLNDPNVN